MKAHTKAAAVTAGRTTFGDDLPLIWHLQVDTVRNVGIAFTVFAFPR